MKLEAVTVCIDFSNQLEKCISNKHLFDRWVIATHETDHDTIQLCKKHNIEYVCSNRVFDQAQFAKGRAINDALSLICNKSMFNWWARNKIADSNKVTELKNKI